MSRQPAAERQRYAGREASGQINYAEKAEKERERRRKNAAAAAELEHRRELQTAMFADQLAQLCGGEVRRATQSLKDMRVGVAALGASMRQQLERQEQRREDQHNELLGAWHQTSANLSTIAHKLDEQEAQLAAMRLTSARVAEANEKATTALDAIWDAKLHAMSAGQQAMLKEVCAVLATLPPLPTPASQ